MTNLYVFPGQGSQHVGMAAGYAGHPLLKTAENILGYDLWNIMQNGPAETLTQTQHTQPALFLHSMLVWDEMKKYAKPTAVAGHSIGEFSAAVAAGCLTFEEALRLVKTRAQAMANAPAGTMAAVLGLDIETITRMCNENGAYVANDNCAGQVVISGEKGAVENASAALQNAGAKRVMPLAVSGAFHTPLMAAVQEKLAAALESVDVRTPQIPFYMVATGQAATTAEAVKANLIAQTASTVKWREVMQNASTAGVTNLVELGAGNVLSKLGKRNAPPIAGTALQTPQDVATFVANMKDST